MNHLTQGFIITGGMGSGKSTLLASFNRDDVSIINEPARQILAEQRSIEGFGVPEINSSLFTELLLSRTTHLYHLAQENRDQIVLFDRGVPDNIAYAQLFGLDTVHYWLAAERYRYNSHVFYLPPWFEIYCTDDERKMSFAESDKFAESLKNIYLELGYQLHEVPKSEPDIRAEFILSIIEQI